MKPAHVLQNWILHPLLDPIVVQVMLLNQRWDHQVHLYREAQHRGQDQPLLEALHQGLDHQVPLCLLGLNLTKVCSHPETLTQFQPYQGLQVPKSLLRGLLVQKVHLQGLKAQEVHL